MRPTSLPRRHRSLASTSGLFRRDCTGTGFCGWSGDVCTNEADRDRDCSSGRRLTGTTRRTRLRIADLSISLSNGSSNFSMRSSGDRRLFYTVNTHCSATTTRLIAQGTCSLRDARGCSSAHLQPFRSPHIRQTTVWMIFSTRTFDTRRSSAATPQHTSCSVTTLTSMRG